MITEMPGYAVWQRGGTREAMQTANTTAGAPCYCASLWTGYCDFCTGLAQPGAPRYVEAMRDLHARGCAALECPDECGEPACSWNHSATRTAGACDCGETAG